MRSTYTYPGMVVLLAIVLLQACSAPETPLHAPLPTATEPGGVVPFAMIEDNVQHDTLLVQVTFDLGAGEFLMVASSVEETYEGLHLYKYTLEGKDHQARINARSSPGYDSWTLLPTFFEDPMQDSAYIVLANVGERNSWGQKVFRMKDRFTDLGFLDVALPEHVTELDSTFMRLRNIGPETRCTADGMGLEFRFVCDSVHLYDDLRGSMDIVVPSSWVRYTWDPEQGMVLWYQGEARPNAQPL